MLIKYRIHVQNAGVENKSKKRNNMEHSSKAQQELKAVT